MSLYPLPPLVLFEDFNGDWDNYEKELYKIFLNSIVDKLCFLGLPVSCRYFEPINDKHRCFWHLISEGEVIDEKRVPDLRRCERISWISHIISNYQEEKIICWNNVRGANNNTVLWLPPEKYMIILSKRNGYYLLITAYMHSERIGKKNNNEIKICLDPRKS